MVNILNPEIDDSLTKSSNDIALSPPACLGIMGGGQLGRMFAIAAKQMGYKVAILEPDLNCPAKLFADYHIVANYDDEAGLDQLAKIAAVVTTEFENVPAKSLDYLSAKVLVSPNSQAILIAQNRLKEKAFFNHNGVDTTKYCSISISEDIKNINAAIFPAILKTNCLGYDGKGQIKVNNPAQLEQAWLDLLQVPCILEKAVDLKSEVSIIIARNSHEKIAYPVVENIHRNGILDLTIAPAQIEAGLQQQIIQMSLTLIEKLDYIGVLAIEYFITTDNKVLANEMAPRPHNSGHYTLDASLTSQFEQQVRSICNLKLGESKLHNNAIMINLLGDIWLNPTTHPCWEIVLAKYPNLKLHLYDKLIAKPGRKMGHITIIGKDMNALKHQAELIKFELGIK